MSSFLTNPDGGVPMTGAAIKLAYESQPDTNAFDDDAQSKLATVAKIYPLFADMIAETGALSVGAIVFVEQVSTYYRVVAAAGDLARQNAAGNHFDVVSADFGNVRCWGAGLAGNTAAIDTAAIKAALAVALMIFVPPGTYLINDTLVLRPFQTFCGAGNHVTLFEITADVEFMNVGTHCFVEGFNAQPASGVTHTKNGVEVGDPGVRSGARAILTRLHLYNFGADNLSIRDGNLGTLRDIVSVGAGADGIRFTDETGDNNGWKLEGFIDLRSNGANGMTLEGGAGSHDATAARTISGNLIVAQQNGQNGVEIQSRNNSFVVYGEANGVNDVLLTALAKGNFVEMLEGGCSDATPLNGNEVKDGNAQVLYRRAFQGKAMFEGGAGRGIRINNTDGTAGEIDFEKVGQREYAFIASGSSATQGLHFLNAVAGHFLDLFVEGRIYPETHDTYDFGSHTLAYRYVNAGSAMVVNGQTGWSGTFVNGDGATVTVTGGIITNVA